MTTEAELLELLREALDGLAQHEPGWSAGYGPYRCKCGYLDWEKRVRKILEGEYGSEKG